MKSIVMYALSTCPWCRKARKFFSDRNVPFECIEYDLADPATQEAIGREMDSLGATGVPIVRIGDEVISGYDPDRFARALGE